MRIAIIKEDSAEVFASHQITDPHDLDELYALYAQPGLRVHSDLLDDLIRDLSAAAANELRQLGELPQEPRP